MRPFFSYYGAKYQVSKYLGAPRRDLVIEPFAGSACYSLRWDCRNVKLYDKSEEIATIWDYLINCSERDILSIPSVLEDDEQFLLLPRPQRLLLGFWVSKGRAESSTTISPWYFQYRNSNDCRVWGDPVKQRIIQQKPMIDRWTIDQLSYDKIPLIEAHWHVDPPYNNAPGSRYKHSQIDYHYLANWCRNLPGSVDVCENDGSQWLPFSPLCSVVTSRGRRSGAVSKEVVWRKL